VRHPAEDPVLSSARREAILVGVNFVAAVVYSVGYCYLTGYSRSAGDLKFVWGFPDWVFWGVIGPWLACVAFSVYFASRFMRAEDLGQDPPGSESDDEFGLGG
jgi:hypothetical protein